MNIKKKIVMFDFDGVLFSNFDVAYSIEAKLNDGLTEEMYKSWFEGNAANASSHTEESYKIFSKLYKDKMDESIPVDGIGDVIKELYLNYNLFIVSSTVSSLIISQLKRIGLSKFFLDIMGREKGHNKSEKISDILNSYKTSPEDSLFITDTLGDINEAKNVGVRSIAVTWGFQEREVLQKGDPYAIIDSVKDIIPSIKKCLGNK